MDNDEDGAMVGQKKYQCQIRCEDILVLLIIFGQVEDQMVDLSCSKHDIQMKVQGNLKELYPFPRWHVDKLFVIHFDSSKNFICIR